MFEITLNSHEKYQSGISRDKSTFKFVIYFFFPVVEIWCTDKHLCQLFSTLPSGSTASGVKTLSLISWTTCGQTSLKRPPMSCRLSWVPSKACGWELVPARFYNTPSRYHCFPYTVKLVWSNTSVICFLVLFYIVFFVFFLFVYFLWQPLYLDMLD